jgi:hypothetical protein
MNERRDSNLLLEHVLRFNGGLFRESDGAAALADAVANC